MSLKRLSGSRFSLTVLSLTVAAGLFVSAFQGPGGPGQGAGQPPGGRGGGGAPGGPGGGGPGGGGPGGGGGGRGQGQGRGAGPARDPNTPAPVGTGSVSGAVSLEGAASPVRRAQVTLAGAELRGNRTTTTGDRGQFSFVALPSGRFTLTVSKPGYVSISYGAKKPGRAGTPIQLADGQKIDNANVSLPRGSVITGVVVDEAGEPSPNTQVRAYRYVMTNGLRTLQQSGQDQTDDRGIYRIFQLQPGEYMVSASPRNQGGAGDARQQLQAQLEPLLQQVQAARGANGAPGAGAAGGRAGAAGAAAAANGRGLGAIGNLLDSNRGQKIIEQVQQLEQQLQQQPDQQTTAYAPVYYPGTTMPASASKVTLGVGEEKSGIDFQLQLVPTARVQGTIITADGTMPQGAQISLQVAGQPDAPTVPGVSTNSARIGPDGKFSFQNVAPGQYTVGVRAAVRQPGDAAAAQDPQAAFGPRGAGPGGRGGRAGGPGAISQVLWASTDITVDGRDIPDLTLSLQPGMTVTGRMTFEAGTLQPPGDLSRSRVTLNAVGSQAMDIGPVPPPQVDSTGNFTITGVAPGRYALRGNVIVAAQGAAGAAGAQQGGLAALGGRGGGVAATGGWMLKSAMVNGVDTLDFPLDIKPNENLNGAILTFTDKSQELSGTLQDATGKPTSDYTIILFAADNRFWTPLSRRILSTRPGTDGKFTFRNLPAGQYRLTAVTDAEQGEWFDPAYLSQIGAASLAVTIGDGEKKVQDIRLAGGF